MYTVGENEHGWHVYDACSGIFCTSKVEANALSAADALNSKDDRAVECLYACFEIPNPARIHDAITVLRDIALNSRCHMSKTLADHALRDMGIEPSTKADTPNKA